MVDHNRMTALILAKYSYKDIIRLLSSLEYKLSLEVNGFTK